MALGQRTWIVIGLSTVLGLFALGWPLIIPAVDVAPQHAGEAPSCSPPCFPWCCCW
ncbi:hypothetical protein G7085_17890 [Tessaracoccus sp. HDW20]|uniref:hypothetical protein n=1 Tax=Tessaracoccus coleopterorum TaxID=2714950 RepID=UPI0018D4D588|nr:hypothetical protein [Tessaracoccus coleopterorum]NHB85804.1 hypothetical protein [Tessaracoccus coleopterorum]